VTPRLDFKVTIVSSVKQRHSGTRYNYARIGRLIEARYDLSNGAVFSYLKRPVTPISKPCRYLMFIVSETIQGRSTVTGMPVGTHMSYVEWYHFR